MSGIKLHLGAGYKKFEGFLNVDMDPNTKPDLQFNLEETWPVESNTVSHVIAHHVMEHLGDPGYFTFMKELYRVCVPGAKVEICVPHHRHDCFLNDPTHRRPITIEGVKLFSKAHNKYCIEVGDGSSCLGLFYDVDFEITSYRFNIDPMYQPIVEKIQPGSEEEQEFQRALRERNNMIVDVHFNMVVIKDE
jgi:hypothetical protein